MPLKEAYDNAAENWFIKCENPFPTALIKFHFFPISDGDLGANAKAKKAYFKQKHRMVWERRYGPVGTGMNPKVESAQAEE